jgi:hypothetical protein
MSGTSLASRSRPRGEGEGKIVWWINNGSGNVVVVVVVIDGLIEIDGWHGLAFDLRWFASLQARAAAAKCSGMWMRGLRVAGRGSAGTGWW